MGSLQIPLKEMKGEGVLTVGLKIKSEVSAVYGPALATQASGGSILNRPEKAAHQCQQTKNDLVSF